jgi:flavin reductase (DIM6/NTAB) family NADH-FMN oxidoreductase RutF
MDKFRNMDLTPVPASQVQAPLIEECPVNLECRVTQVVNLGSHDLILGQVIASHIDESLLDERGRIRTIVDAKPIAYSSLTAEYVSLGSVIGRYGFSRSQDEDL